VARPRSDDKQGAILSAAVRAIAAQGLGAPTAAIAKGSGVSNGSLFTYFGTKADLLNRLYLDLKAEMAAAALEGLPWSGETREQMRHVWLCWVRWATMWPEKRRTLALLDVADEITPASRQTSKQTMAEIAGLLERSRENGPMRDAPLGLVLTLMSALADATIDYIIRDPANGDQHASDAFEALWRIVA
jgi:AcrR family transcriptional regulator